MRYFRDFFPYPPSQPREAKGGIKAHSQRGAFVDKWWGKRWIKVLESFGIGARLQRGRAYARRGQVIDLHIGSDGEITARVQGSRPAPYEVALQLLTFSVPEWERVAVALSERPAYMAKLLAGEMPEEIEEAFAQAKLSLFPATQDDLETECSCPDWSNPCKHIAAVYYLLAEAFDQDPFLLFKLRGMDRESLLQLVLGAGQQEEEGESGMPPGEPLPSDAVQFWGGAEPELVDLGETTLPTAWAVLAKRLGAFPFWRGSRD
jgi:uncharacterized Zn finger protein